MDTNLTPPGCGRATSGHSWEEDMILGSFMEVGPEQLWGHFSHSWGKTKVLRIIRKSLHSCLLLCTPLSLAHPVSNSLFALPQTYSYLRAFECADPPGQFFPQYPHCAFPSQCEHLAQMSTWRGHPGPSCLNLCWHFLPLPWFTFLLSPGHCSTRDFTMCLCLSLHPRMRTSYKILLCFVPWFLSTPRTVADVYRAPQLIVDEWTNERASHTVSPPQYFGTCLGLLPITFPQNVAA